MLMRISKKLSALDDGANRNSVFTVSGIEKALTVLTRSSAVAERPRDASCLSVLVLTVQLLRAQSFIISCLGFRYTNA